MFSDSKWKPIKELKESDVGIKIYFHSIYGKIYWAVFDGSYVIIDRKEYSLKNFDKFQRG